MSPQKRSRKAVKAENARRKALPKLPPEAGLSLYGLVAGAFLGPMWLRARMERRRWEKNS